MEQVVERILSDKIIAIVRGLEPEHMCNLADALYSGGITAIEVTFNQSRPDLWIETERAISVISARFAGRMLVGAGTVMSPEQVRRAANSGAQYIISPNVNASVIQESKALGMVSLPGAMTPTEIALAIDEGADFVKIFPAGTLGTEYIKAVKAPLSHAKLMAVGGITEKNAADFMRVGCVGVGVGGNLVNKDWIAAGEFEKITALAREYVRAVR